MSSVLVTQMSKVALILKQKLQINLIYNNLPADANKIKL
jgi:hypothetical protein